MGFHELLRAELSAARDRAEGEHDGDASLREWWRWRAGDLQRYLDDLGPVRE